MRVIFLGPPGAGKGTQAALLSKGAGIPHISTGEMLREAVASGSKLGVEVKAVLDRGDLVSDALMIDLIRERLAQPDAAQGFLLDGYPRTVQQARALEELLAALGRPLTHIVELTVPEEVLVQRIAVRATQGAGRSDDTAEVAKRRLKVFWEQTAPVVEFYRAAGTLRQVNGLGSVEEVQERIRQVLEQE